VDWSNWQDIGLLVLVVALFVGSIFFRKRRTGTAPMVIAMGLYRDVDKNQKLVEAFSFRLKIKKFKTKTWQKHKNRVDFLGEELRAALTDAFKPAEDFNQQIDAAQKKGSSSYLSAIQVDKLKEPLARCRQGLEKWIQDNWGNRDLYPKRIGFFR